MRKVRIQIPVTEQIRIKLQVEADKKGISLAEVVRDIINKSFD